LIAFSATGQRGFLFPQILTQEISIEEATLEERIRQASADNLPFQAGENVSEERRRDYWQEGDRKDLSFAEQNRQWNESMHSAIRTLTAPPREDAPQKTEKAEKAELARDTLQHLGLTGADAQEEKAFTSQEKGEQRFALYSDIEVFRTNYLSTKSDVKGFVRKIAEQCPGVNGQVDVGKLQARLEAIRPILISFGDQSVDSLIEDFAVSYGLLTQRREAKAAIAAEVKTKLSSPIREEKAAVYDKLARIQQEIEQPVVTGREEEPPPGREQPAETAREQEATGREPPPREEEPQREEAAERPQEPSREETRVFRISRGSVYMLVSGHAGKRHM
jgi:hypothetical protein